MSIRIRARTDRVTVGVYAHTPEEPANASEWWDESCVAFSTFGSWELDSRRGSGQVSPSTVLVASGSAEYDCRHPEGLDDRMLLMIYHDEPDLGPAALVPHTGFLRVLTRGVAAELRSRDVDGEQIDSLCEAITEAVRARLEEVRPASERTRTVVERLRAIVDEYYLDATLDLVGEAAELGLSRTRFIHNFLDVVGLTPHRYLVGRRTSHAAHQLMTTDATVAEVCFNAGFGTIASFQEAFKTAFGTTPTCYRAVSGQRAVRRAFGGAARDLRVANCGA